ncbi:MAG: acetoacetate--CoA ligase [candidate division Zixibacteria bacterium]|jgi:acetoacetyl-CoA synthetase|nr:acetoacetate--CoA ligase [candidate division Zixibacteria bacterium]
MKPLWEPPADYIPRTEMSRYMGWLADRLGRHFNSYAELYDWSINNVEAFWQSIWEFMEIVHSREFGEVRTGSEIWNSVWFEGARLNFAENLLRYRDNHTAIVACAEDDTARRLTYAQLYRQVAACASGLKRLGVGTGDRVAAIVPNSAEAVIAMLATTSLGAIWSSCSPDFGSQGVLDRFGQIAPKVLFAADSCRYNGKNIDITDRVAEVIAKISSIERAVVFDHLGEQSGPLPPKSISWDGLMDPSAKEVTFEQLPFDQPVYIMYSSGTTGKPKCIVHGAGGTLLQHAKEHRLHTDIRRDDVVFYYTTCGWMMWNWLVGVLSSGATIVLYDGSPSHPTLGTLWKLAEQERISVFGTSPKYLTALEDRHVRPGEKFDLKALRTILSTGSPLAPANFEYVYRHIKPDIQLASISGGTDIISCFMLGCPILPVYSGEIQCRGLGMKVETFNDRGEPVLDEVGELVCTAPFPSRPVFFWDDADGARYRNAYFDRWPGVWHHGDYIRITPRGGVIVYGRSDATLNPGGVRIGTAEIYGPVEALPEIADSLAVAQQWGSDVRIVLFVVPAEGVTCDDALRGKIRDAIRTARSPRHVPAKIIAVKDIPHTLNGKKVEIAVTRIIHGFDVANREALANPGSLEQFRSLPDLQEP